MGRVPTRPFFIFTHKRENMTLKQIISTISNLALKHPNINSVYEGSVYDNLNASPSNKYASVVLTQTTHTQDENFDHYGFVIFYVDRLVDDLEENRVQIQSIGKTMLSNIINAFCDEFNAEFNNLTFTPFTQKFADETAGVYVDVIIDTPKDAICAERYWDDKWTIQDEYKRGYEDGYKKAMEDLRNE